MPVNNPKGINQYSPGGKSYKTSKAAMGAKFGLDNAAKLRNAATMFGTNSKQYKAAKKRFGK